MGLALDTAPSVEPVTTADQKSHMKVDDATDDTYIGTLITAARQWCETYLNRALITQTWVWKLDGFPSNNCALQLPRPPLQSVSSITYLDTAGDSQTWASSKYQVTTDGVYGEILPEPTESYPTTESSRLNAVTITFIAGFGDAATDVPNTIIHAIKMLAAHWYEHREQVSDVQFMPVPMAVESLLNTERALFVA